MENLDSLINGVFRSEALGAEFASIPALINEVPAEFRLPIVLEMLEHPPFPLMLQQISNLNVVYSLQKVGSTTMCEALAAHPAINCRSKVRHVHFLGQKGLAFLNEQLSGCRTNPNAQVWVQHLAHCHWMRVLLAANRTIRSRGMAATVRKPFVITGVREPVAQYLSMVFENWWMYAEPPEALTTDFIRTRMRDDPWLRQCNDWYTDDLRETTGVDVYSRPFPTDRGWEVYENDVARLLVIRQENLNRLPDAVGSLYGFDPTTIRVPSANEGNNKHYAAQYGTVKKTFHLSEPELEEVYARPHVRHFYSPEEIEGFKRRWRVPGGEPSPLLTSRHNVPEQPRGENPRKVHSAVPEMPSVASRVLAKCRNLVKRVLRRGQTAR